MSAILSPCGTYRYRLDRDCEQDGPVVAYFGINPSTADAEIDDATVRKWKGFSSRNGFGRFIVGNVFAYRATNVKELSKLPTGILFGTEYLEHLDQIIDEADILIPCWGSLAKLRKELRVAPSRFLDVLLKANKPILHFGKNDDGTPKHPLMLGYDTPLIPWEK